MIGGVYLMVHHWMKEILPSKKGELAWEYIAAFILIIIVLIAIVFFSSTLKEKAIEAIKHLITGALGK